MKYRLNLSVARMAMPLIISNLTVPLLGLTNTIVVGHLEHSYYLGAVGIGTMIFNFIYWAFGFFRMSTTGLIAKAHGQQTEKQQLALVSHSLLLALAIGLLLITLQWPIGSIAFFIIGAHKKVAHYAIGYYYIRIWGAPAVLINFVLIGVFIGIQRMRAPLVMMSITNLLAILLCIYFVFGFHWAVNGVASADVIAQYFGVIVGVLLLKRYIPLVSLWKKFQLNITLLLQLFSTNRDILIRTLCLLAVFSFFTIESNRLGPLILAANTVLLNFFMVMSYGLDGFCNVAEALVGKAVGAKDHDTLWQSIVDTAGWTLLLSIAFTLAIFIFGHDIIGLMTDLPLVIYAANNYLLFVIVLPLIASWSFLLDGIAIGANQFRSMRDSMLVTVLVFFALWFVLKDHGNTGLWLAFSCFFIVRATVLAWLLRKPLSPISVAR